MSATVKDCLAPVRAVNLTIEGEEDLAVIPVDPALKRLLDPAARDLRTLVPPNRTPSTAPAEQAG